jgi:hypothetical protein
VSASQATGLGNAKASEPSGLGPTGAIPRAAELERMLDELLDPLKGIERGLMETDNDSLLVNIRVDASTPLSKQELE